MREKISLNDTLETIVRKLSLGNPGALRVCMELMQDQMGFGLILDLDDMNMRGPQIWIAYKDHCREDLDLFKRLIRERDPDMVATVNNSAGHSEPKAVTSGASF